MYRVNREQPLAHHCRQLGHELFEQGPVIYNLNKNRKVRKPREYLCDVHFTVFSKAFDPTKCARSSDASLLKKLDDRRVRRLNTGTILIVQK